MNKNKRRISVLVTAQTLWHLENLAWASGYGKNIGKVIDKLTREKALQMAARPGYGKRRDDHEND